MSELTVSTQKPIYEVDPKMVVELALGQRPHEEIAASYGLTESEWEQLRVNKYFRLQVASKLDELQRTGVTFKMKAAMAAETLLEDLFRRARDPEIGTAGLLQIAQWMTKVGDLEPKEAAQQGGGNQFSVVINMPAANAAPETKVIEGISLPA